MSACQSHWRCRRWRWRVSGTACASGFASSPPASSSRQTRSPGLCAWAPISFPPRVASVFSLGCIQAMKCGSGKMIPDRGHVVGRTVDLRARSHGQGGKGGSLRDADARGRRSHRPFLRAERPRRVLAAARDGHRARGGRIPGAAGRGLRASPAGVRAGAFICGTTRFTTEDTEISKDTEDARFPCVSPPIFSAPSECSGPPC